MTAREITLYIGGTLFLALGGLILVLGFPLKAHASVVYTSTGTYYAPFTGDNVQASTTPVSVLQALPVGFDLDLAGNTPNSAWVIFPRRVDGAPLSAGDCLNFRLTAERASSGTGYGNGYPGFDYFVLNSAGNGCMTNSAYGFYPTNSYFNQANGYVFISTSASSTEYQYPVGAYVACDTRASCDVAPAPLSPSADRTTLQINNPTQGTTTPTTTFDIDVAYHIGADLSSYSISGVLPDRMGINFAMQNTAYGTTQDLGTDWSIPFSAGSYTYSTTTTVAQGDYTLIATLVGDYGFVPPPAGCEPFPPFTTCEGSGNIATIVTALPPPTFSVANGSFPLLGFNVGSTSSRNGLATTTCDVLHVGGCFQNALAFLFYPSPDILNQFSFLGSLIKNKPPFGYVSQTIGTLRTLNASSTPAFSFGDIPLVDTIFTPFRTGLAGILWLGFFIAWYRGRLRHLDI